MIQGSLSKMRVTLEETVRYDLMLESSVTMNELIGQEISIRHTGVINCTACGAVTKKSFGQGFCYTCFIQSPESSECILRPELCRAHLGEGRDVEWENLHHNQPHVVYLALTDVVKVGVTRAEQVVTRWIDQGAYQAIRLAETQNRYQAGIIEVALKFFFSDKTNWRKMLRNENDMSIDLIEEKWRLAEQLPSDISEFITENDELVTINYPVLSYPEKLNSLSFDKDLVVRGKLFGIKGQYLIFDGDRVLNLRKHTGYRVELNF